MKIVLDAGHGLYTAGKRCMKSLDSKETREWILNSRIASLVEKKLKAYDVEVLRVDDRTGKTDVPLYYQVRDKKLNCKSREQLANDYDADVYISIHHNAGASGKASGGTVCYYYSINPLRKKQCQSLYNHIVQNTKLVGNRSEKIIKNAFSVLKYTKMAAFLIENGFMDSSTDVPIILTEEHAEKTAQGIVEFLVEYLNLKASYTLVFDDLRGDKDTLSKILASAKKIGLKGHIE